MAKRLFPLPLNAACLQPLIVAPSEVKATVPVGALPVTVAVKVTLVPPIDGFSELPSTVVVAPDVRLLTVCESAVLDDATLPLSPL